MSTSYPINQSRVSPNKSSGSGYMICFLENGLGSLKMCFCSVYLVTMYIYTERSNENSNTDSVLTLQL